MLIERAEPLARLTALAEEAAAGEGRLVFLGGEPGVGKTSLAAALAGEVADRLRVRRGTCDDVGPAAALGALVEAVPERAEEIERTGGDDRIALFRRLLADLAAEPTLLVVEDVHWADDATLGMLRFLGRRLTGRPLLVLATYRDGEAPPGSPLRLLLGDLATAAGVGRMLLSPLSADGVRQLAAAAGSPLDPEALHASTGGNPFYVTETLAIGAADLPATVRDAVLARIAHRSPAARQVLAAAAVLGQPTELPLLTTISGAPAEAVDECVQAGVLVPDGDRWTFRHELARRAVEASLPPGRRAGLHTVVLRTLRDAGETDDARLAHHAAESGDRDAVAAYAPRAAERAARLGAHRQAAQLYQLALRATSPSGPARGPLCEALSYECYLVNETEEAHAAQEQALAAARSTGDPRVVGTNLRWLSRLSWQLARRADAERLAAEAIATLEPLGDGRELAMAYANLANLTMLAADTGATVEWGNRAIDLARRIGDPHVEIHALTTVGTALVNRSDSEEGWAMLRQGLDLALLHDSHEHVGRAYLNLTACGLTSRRYEQVHRDVAAGAAYCDERDLDVFGHQIRFATSRALIEQGRYAEAEEDLARMRSRPSLSGTNRMALGGHIGIVAARRDGVVAPELEEAWRYAEHSGEEQLITVMGLFRVEALWIGGRTTEAVAELERIRPFTVQQGNPWSMGELCWWLAMTGAPGEPPVPVAEPWALLLAGEWRAAADAWARLDCPLLVAYSLGRSPDLADGRRAAAIAEEVGAHAARQAILRDRHTLGLPVPHGPRSATRGNPSRLTRRELEVLRLLAEGLSNPEIAARLYLSDRTVAHHVSAVLQKLGEPTRSRAVAAAVRRGIVAPETTPC